MNLFTQVVKEFAHETVQDEKYLSIPYWSYYVMAFVFGVLDAIVFLGTVWTFTQIADNLFFLVPAVVGVILTLFGALLVGAYMEVGFQVKEKQDA